VNTSAPTAKLDVNGTLRFRNGATNNYVLASDASGYATWQDPNSLVSGDNLGNHTATQTLNMNSHEISNVHDIIISSNYSIETQGSDRNIEVSDANPSWYGDSYGGEVKFHGDGNISRSKLEAGGLELNRKLYVGSESYLIGSVGIGTSGPTEKLDVNGNVRIRKTGYSSRIGFDAQTNDPGEIIHYENNNAGELWLSSSDDWDAAATND